MKSDFNACSTCPKGEENFETFYSPVLRKKLVQYDYRHTDGSLFSCVAVNLEAARSKRDAWMNKKGVQNA